MNIYRALLMIITVAGPMGCLNRGDGREITASGYVEATEVRVGTKVSGTLIQLAVDEGDQVTKDQLIAKIDPVDLELSLRAAQAEKTQYEADLRGAEKDYRRMQDLLDAGSGTGKARDDAKSRFDMTAGRVAVSIARIGQLEQQIKDTTVRSPIGGVVTQKLVEQGELLAPGSTLVVVTDLNDSWLTAYVGEPDLPRIRLGQEAKLLTDAGITRPGKITYIASTAEFTPKNVQTKDERVKLVYKIKVAMENSDGLFKPGMPAQTQIEVSGAK
ncbi:MAG TPA: efflux RND transporter periplasmic adaptor subunit [Bdellovibrionota bacterium]|nr:efflux RND transporter periplasmic adaptor subunit [Bdellovibrionota bacterium]